MSKIGMLAAPLLMNAMAAAARSKEARRDAQSGRIEQGRVDGFIAWREGLKLRKEQPEIQRLEAALESDGTRQVRR